jgi:hypothetical protein
MSNDARIKGNDNFVFQGNRNSKINLQNKNQNLPPKQNYALIGLIVAILGVISTIIIGWSNIVNLFTK